MRPILPIAAAVLLTAGAVSIPALTQAAQAQHHWKKANIDTSAMSASMSAQNPNAFAPATTDQQPGAITAGATSSDAAPTGTNTMPADQSTDSTMQPTSGKDSSATTAAKHKTMKHAKKPKTGSTTTPDTTPNTNANTPADTSAPGAISSGSSSSDQGMTGNSATMGANSSPTASPTMSPDDSSATAPDTSKANTTPPATSGSSSSPQ